MLAIENLVGFAFGPLDRRERENLKIQSIRVSGWHYVAEIIDTCGLEAANNLVYQARVDQGTITGNPHYGIGPSCSSRLDITIQYIIFASAVAAVTERRDMIDQWLITYILGSGNHNFIDLGRPRQSGEQQFDHRHSTDRLHHLIGKTGGTHASL